MNLIVMICNLQEQDGRMDMKLYTSYAIMPLLINGPRMQLKRKTQDVT